MGRRFSPTVLLTYKIETKSVERKTSKSFKIHLAFKKSLFIFILLESKPIHRSENKGFLIFSKTYHSRNLSVYSLSRISHEIGI